MPNEHDMKLAFHLERLLDQAASSEAKPVVSKGQLVSCFKLHLKSFEGTPDYPIEVAWVLRQLNALRVEGFPSVPARDRLFLMMNLVRHRTKDVWHVPEVLIRRTSI